jgi:hypothetical protein
MPCHSKCVKNVADNESKQDEPGLDAVKSDKEPAVQSPHHHKACNARANNNHVSMPVRTRLGLQTLDLTVVTAQRHLRALLSRLRSLRHLALRYVSLL